MVRCERPLSAEERHIAGAILRIVLPYVLFAGLWIFLSDRLLDLLPLDTATHTQLSIYKGWAFVLVTAALLWVLLQTELGARERARAAQRRIEEQLRLLGDNLPDSYVYQYTHDADGKPRFLYLSSGVERLHSVKAGDVIGDAGVLHGQISADQLAALQAAEMNSLRNLADFTIELRMLLPDGAWRWLRMCSRPRRESDGRVVWDGVATDITGSKRAEAERRRLADIIERSLNEIFIFDSQTFTFRHANQGALKNLQYTLGEIVAMTPLDLKPQLSEATFRAMIEPLLTDEQESLTFETVHRRADGSLYPVEVHLQLVNADDERLFLAVIFDITERKRAEEEREKLHTQLQQAQKMESVGRLAGGVAHDFNNMLSVILGHAELALMKLEPSQPFYSDLLEIHAAAERSADLTRQLLAFARKQAIAPKVLDLNETVEGMLKLLQRLIGEDIDLAWKGGTGVWPVKIDPSQLDQIMANLCVNARDAITGVGNITIETSNAHFDQNFCAEHAGFVAGEFAMLAVSDDGCGMGKDTLGKIFDPFFTTKEIGKGTGLGLATVYGIVNQNNGFINVYSEPGHGTTFKIYLPRHADAEVAVRERVYEPAAGGDETILLVEDQPELLEMGKAILESFGYAVLPVGSPDDAIHLAEEYGGEIPLLITDVIMPKMNGCDLAQRLQAVYPNLSCLFMSGYTSDVITSRGVLGEGVHFIQKPFTMQGLAAKVREALDARNC